MRRFLRRLLGVSDEVAELQMRLELKQQECDLYGEVIISYRQKVVALTQDLQTGVPSTPFGIEVQGRSSRIA
jgi:hypothetical protein